MMSNSLQQVNNMKESTLPAKKRMINRVIDSALKANKPVSSVNWALVNADIGMLLNRDEVADHQTKGKMNVYSVVSRWNRFELLIATFRLQYC